MAIEIDIVANETSIESALNKISTRLRKIEIESRAVSNNVSNLGVKSIDSKQVSQELKALRQDLSKTNKEISSSVQGLANGISGAVQGLAVALTSGALVAGFVSATNQATDYANRIALITGRTEDLIDVQKELLNISARTYGSLDGSVETFNRFGQALKGTKTTQEDLLKVTETVQKTIAISGGAASSASAAIFQLGQGLSAGALRGQELNSVMEQAPRLATALANELGVSMGGLRKIAEDGGLTTQVVLNALQNQAEVISNEFLNISPSIAKASTVFLDSAVAYIGQLDKGIGLSKGIALEVLRLATVINTASEGLDVRVAAKLEELDIRGRLRGISLVAGGVVNVIIAIVSRIGDSLPKVILPVLTIFDELTLALAKIPSIKSLINFTKQITDARAATLDFATGGVSLAGAFQKVFESSSPEELRENLDGLALTIDRLGRNWFNVGNFITTAFRSTNYYLLTTGRYLGLIDQSLLSLRFTTFEDFGFAISLVSNALNELVINVAASQFFKPIFKAILILENYFLIISSLISQTFRNVGRSLRSNLLTVSFSITETFKGISETSKVYLLQAIVIIEDFANKVKAIFYDLYIYLVGNSVWPDTIMEIIDWSKELDQALTFIDSFVKKVKERFEEVQSVAYDLGANLLAKVGAIEFNISLNIPAALESFLLFLRYVQREILTIIGTSIIDVWAYLTTKAPVLGTLFGAALIVGIGEALGVGLFSILTALFTGALVSSVLNSIISESGDILLSEGFFRNLGAGIGSLIGQIFVSIVANLPFLVQGLMQAAKGFGEGLLSQLGVVGNAISSLLSVFTPVGVSIIELALFGGTAALLLGKIGMVTTFVTSALTLLTGRSIGTNPNGILGFLLLGPGKILIGLLLAVTAILTLIPSSIDDIISSVAGFITLGGLAGVFLFGPGATSRFIVQQFDNLLNFIGSRFAAFRASGFAFNFADMLFPSGGGGNLSGKLRYYYDLITQSFGDATARGLLRLQIQEDLEALSQRFQTFGTNVASRWSTVSGAIASRWSTVSGAIASRWSTVSGAIASRWSTVSTALAAGWSSFSAAASTALTAVSARFAAFQASLAAGTFMTGPIALLIRFAALAAGIAALFAAFAGQANASESAIESVGDTAQKTLAQQINSALEVGTLGLLGLTLLGIAKNPAKTVSIFINLIVGAINTVRFLGSRLLSLTNGLGFATAAVAGSAPAQALKTRLLAIGAIAINWAMTLGWALMSRMGTFFSAVQVMTGLAATTMAAALGFLIPAVLLLGGALLVFGDGIGEWAADLLFKFTGIGNQARKLKKEIQDILTVGKVGTIDIQLKSRLDEINFSVLSEKEVNRLQRELVNANNIFEKNQSIYQEEGDLTRSQIQETNTALSTANSYLDKLANRGEKSFASGLVNLFDDNIKGGLGSIEKDILGIVSKAPGFDADSAKQLVAPVFNRLEEVLDNPNATQEQVAQAIMKLEGLLSKGELTAFVAENPELAAIQQSILRNQNVLERMATGADTVATAAQLAFLQTVEERLFEENPEAQLARLDKRIEGALARIFTGNPQAEALLKEDARNRNIAVPSGITNLTDVLNLLEPLGLTTGQAIIDFLEINQLSNSVDFDQEAFLSLLARRESLLTSISEDAGQAREIQARESVIGGITDQVLSDRMAIKDLESRITAMLGERTSSEGKAPEIDFSALTDTQFQNLDTVVKTFESDLNNFFSDVYSRTAMGGPALPEQLKLVLDSTGIIKPEDLALVLAVVENGLPFLNKDELKAYQDILKARDAALAAAVSSISSTALQYMNENLSSTGFDFKLEFIDDSDYALLEKAITGIKGLQDRLNKGGMSLIDIKKAKAELEELQNWVFSNFAPVDAQMEKIRENISGGLSLVKNARSIDEVLLLDPKAVTRAAQLGVIISKIMALLQSGSVIGLNSLEIADLETQLALAMGEFSSLVSKPDEPKKGGKKSTWWETLVGNVGDLDIGVGANYLASISKTILDQLVTSSAKYKAAQDAINKSAAHEVELRKQAVEQMRLARKEAIAALNDGTYQGFIAQMEAMGSDLDASFIGTLNAAQAAYAQGITQRIDALKQESQTLEVGSAKLRANTNEISTLTLKLSEMQSTANTMSSSFNTALQALMKGETGFKGFLESLLDTFTNTIIQKFSTGFTDSLFKALDLDNLFNTLFSNVFETGSQAGGAVGSILGGELGSSITNPMYVRDISSGGIPGATGTTGATAADPMAGITGWISKLFSGLGSLFTGLLNSLTSLFSGGGGSGKGNFLMNIFSAFAGNMGGSSLAPKTSLRPMARPFATGGYVAGPGGPKSDSILAALSNGEYVVNAATTKRWLPFLQQINDNNGRLPAFANGGMVGPSNPEAMKTMVSSNPRSKQEQVFNINITGDVSMQTRKEIASMIPEITSGVNMTNRERGSR